MLKSIAHCVAAWTAVSPVRKPTGFLVLGWLNFVGIRPAGEPSPTSLTHIALGFALLILVLTQFSFAAGPAAEAIGLLTGFSLEGVVIGAVVISNLLAWNSGRKIFQSTDWGSN